MKVILTGASGFLGKNLLLRVPDSWEVFGLFNSSGDFEDFVKKECGRNIIPFRCDLRKASQVKKLKSKIGKKIDLVLYFAANTNPAYSVEQPIFDLDSNVSALINFFENFTSKKTIYLSSLAVYGGAEGLVTAKSNLVPTLPYGISKLAAEQYIKFYHSIKKRISNYVILRFFGAYGPYEPPQKIFTKLINTFFINKKDRFKVRGNGNNNLDVMYIEDAVRGIMNIVNRDGTNGVFNFGTGRPVTINELVKCVANLCGVKDPVILHEGKTYEYTKFYMNPKDIRTNFSFKPEISLTDGVRKFATFLMEHQKVAQIKSRTLR